MFDKIKKSLPLIISVVFFISFGLYHLAKFETVDEHFWKYDRVQQYYTGIKEGFTKHSFKKTHINDKPGITVAMLSGMSLPFIPDPYEHEDFKKEKKYTYLTKKRSDPAKNRTVFTLFHTDQTEAINFGFRLPILLFNALIMLPLFFWLLKRAFGYKIASISILLIGLNPILIGMSQIANPDALFWSFSAGAFFAFFALLKTNEKKFIILTGLFTGFSLLSKYTSNLLFIFFPIIFIFNGYFKKHKEEEAIFPVVKKYLDKLINIIQVKTEKINKTFSHNIKNFLLIFTNNSALNYITSLIPISLISWTTFAFFMPAVIHKPQHFLYGTLYSPPLWPITDLFIKILHLKDVVFTPKNDYKIIPLAILSLSIFTLFFIILPPLFIKLFKRFNKTFAITLKIIATSLLLIFSFSLFNAWTNESIFELNDLKETSINSKILDFPQFENDPTPLFYLKGLLAESQAFVFSVHPIIVFSIFLISILLIFNKFKDSSENKNRLSTIAILYFIISMPFVFFIGGLISDVFVNIRYSIMLYPIFSLLGAIGLITFTQKIKQCSFYKKFNLNKNNVFYGLMLIIILTHFISLIKIKPFYFNYLNFLLPKEYLVTDSWGYGIYEAAQYLNSRENAEDLVVWTDRSGTCQFFVGKCIDTNEIYLDQIDVDYMVINRRGSITNRPSPMTSNPNHWFLKNNYYSEKFLDNPEWELNIGDRPENFIKVVNTGNPNRDY